MLEQLGTIGVWRTAELLTPDIAAQLEDLGFSAIWIGGSPHGDLRLAQSLLEATRAVTIATSIINIWSDPADQVAASFQRLEKAHPGRFLLGIGVGHREATGMAYIRPYQAVERYLDQLDAAGVPAERRVLAALGPRMVTLAAQRSAGPHPYLTTPDHTRTTRAQIGPGPILIPEQKVVLATDPARAIALARASIKPYLAFSNYTNSWRTQGFEDVDFSDGGSDRLIKTLFAIGNPSTAMRRTYEHLAGGANHVAVQLISPPNEDPMPDYAALSRALIH